MKILRLFGKKTPRHDLGAPLTVLPLTVLPLTEPPLTELPHTEPSEEARNTTQKIDAIESAMSAEFGALPLPEVIASTAVTLPQTMEEAAILFASGQAEAALNLLTEATAASPATTAPPQEQLAWGMLFDLCQLHDRQARFEQLAIDYARRFETSPPQWNSLMPTLTQARRTESVASLNFSGKLCANSQPLLEHLRKLGEPHAKLCVELGVISEIDSAGCAQLLAILQHWQSGHRQVMLKGAQGLVDGIRGIIQTGRRDDNDAAWLLLIELLRLMNEQASYEEICVDYCITFEVSPPTFNPPALHTAHAGQQFLLPTFIEAPVDSLLQSIAAATSGQSAVVLDCAQLASIHFTAAAPLIAGLIRLANGKPVELQNTNFLVSVLLKLVGSKSLQISTRKL